MNTSLQLLKAKRSSALKDARKIEAQLARLNKSKLEASPWMESNLRCIGRMFREHIATLDEAIKSAHIPRRQSNSSLSA